MELASLSRYLRMPLRGGALGVIVLFALLLALASRAGLFGLPLALILLSWFFKYGFALLDHVTDGGDDPPALSIEMVNPASEQRSLVLLLLVIGIFFASNAAAFWFGRVLGSLLGFVLIFIVPAIVAVQGATGSLLQSLDLNRVVRLITRLGRDYLLIVACAALLLTLAVVAARTATIPIVVRLAFDMYACLAVFAIIGGVLFERRLDIGLDAAYSPERLDSKKAREQDHERDRVIDHIYAEWRGGAHINACKSITELLEQSDDPSVELEWLYEKTAHWPDARLPNQLAHAWLPHLLAQKRHGRLLELLRERLAIDPHFRPVTSAELLQCARLASEGGERKTARLLLNGFAERFPNDVLSPMANELSRQLER